MKPTHTNGNGEPVMPYLEKLTEELSQVNYHFDYQVWIEFGKRGKRR